MYDILDMMDGREIERFIDETPYIKKLYDECMNEPHPAAGEEHTR